MRLVVPLVALLLVTGSARADILPEPDSADAHCTLAEQCPDGNECPSGLRQDAGVVQACVDATKTKGLAYRCHRGGNYSGTAVYCLPQARGSWTAPTPTGSSASPAPDAPTPSTRPHGHCAVSPGPASAAPFALVAAALALLVIRRRR